MSKNDIMVDLAKIEAIHDWATTTSITEVKRLVGYYKQFVEGFSMIVARLTWLTRQGISFAWFDECESSFLRLKGYWLSLLSWLSSWGGGLYSVLWPFQD